LQETKISNSSVSSESSVVKTCLLFIDILPFEELAALILIVRIALHGGRHGYNTLAGGRLT